MKWHIHWPAGVLALIGVVFFAADRLTRTPTVVHAVPGQVIEIPVARDGHYYLEGSVNGVPLRFMIDTGATYVAVGGKVGLLGQNFLKRFEVSQSDGVMRLRLAP